MIYETDSGRCKELKLAYTNTEGLTSVRRDLEENEPHMIGLTETKLNEEIEVLNTGKRNRTDKQGIGGMITVKGNITVDQVICGEGQVQVLRMRIKEKVDKKGDLAVVYTSHQK